MSSNIIEIFVVWLRKIGRARSKTWRTCQEITTVMHVYKCNTGITKEREKSLRALQVVEMFSKIGQPHFPIPHFTVRLNLVAVLAVSYKTELRLPLLHITDS